jgi:hypothetical protein
MIIKGYIVTKYPPIASRIDSKYSAITGIIEGGNVVSLNSYVASFINASSSVAAAYITTALPKATINGSSTISVAANSVGAVTSVSVSATIPATASVSSNVRTKGIVAGSISGTATISATPTAFAAGSYSATIQAGSTISAAVIGKSIAGSTINSIATISASVKGKSVASAVINGSTVISIASRSKGVVLSTINVAATITSGVITKGIASSTIAGSTSISAAPTATSAGGGGTFAPTDISDLAIWLEADNITGAVDGDAIGTWTDLSGNGRNATQTGATQKPLYKTGIINGKPVLRFDASNDALETSFFLSGSYSIFIVERFTSNLGAVRTLNSPSANSVLSGQRSDGNSVYHNVSPVSSYYTAAPATVLLNLETGNPNFVYTVNGVDRTTYAKTSEAWGTITLGASGMYPEPANSDVAAVIIYNKMLTVSERTSIVNYLNTKYAIY